MKKIFALLLLTLFSSTLFAAFQYEIVEAMVSSSGSYPAVSGYSYYVRITEGSGSIYISDKISSLGGGNNEVLSLVLKDVNNPATYGWVDKATGQVHNAEGSSVVLYHDRINANNAYVTRTAYKLGDFQAGDEFGVWLTAAPAKAKDNALVLTGASILDKTAPVNASYMNYREYGGTADTWGNPLAQLDIDNAKKSIFFGFHGVENTSFGGQPLPGMLATFLLGGSVLSAAGLKRKKKRS